ncbi:MAG: aldehyde dehydrogenase family protein [Deltaproteobacteria bacterium]|nr:aldehyde dehydrogenase family protein [Deltaproteobacteria bacterium]
METLHRSNAAPVKSISGTGIKSTNPASGEVLGEVPNAGPEEVRIAVARARAAQESWGLLSVAERSRRLFWFRDAIVTRSEEIVDLLTRETGKPRIEALTHEILVVADLITFYAKHAADILAPRQIGLHLMKHRRSYVHHAPLGVVGVISPWNFPFSIPLSETVTALFVGNAVVVKPSEVTPLIALKAKEIYDAAGLPPDLFQVVTGDGRTGAALIDAGVDKIVFTGSVAGGRKVAAACGERLIPCTMELGGKAAAIVCEDADLERTARAIVWGGFANNGQVCVSVERVLAVDAVHDRLVDRVVELTGKLRQGDPSYDEVELGAITFPRQIENAERLIADAVSKGATVRTGGKRVAGKGLFFEPTVLTGCTTQMDVMKEEIFGPVVPIMKVPDEREAIRIANDSRLGLAGYVFTRDRDRGKRLAEQIRAGSVQVNDVLTSYGVTDAPFGGVKDSGFGRVHGPEGLLAMCEVRHVNLDRFSPMKREPTWYPYSNKSYRVALKAIRFMFGPGGVLERVTSILG